MERRIEGGPIGTAESEWDFSASSRKTITVRSVCSVSQHVHTCTCAKGRESTDHPLTGFALPAAAIIFPCFSATRCIATVSPRSPRLPQKVCKVSTRFASICLDRPGATHDRSRGATWISAIGLTATRGRPLPQCFLSLLSSLPLPFLVLLSGRWPQIYTPHQQGM